METQTRLSRHNKFISAENIIYIYLHFPHEILTHAYMSTIFV